MKRDIAAWIALGITVVGFLWNLSDRAYKPVDDNAKDVKELRQQLANDRDAAQREIRELRERVAVLDALQRYSHGDLRPFIKE